MMKTTYPIVMATSLAALVAAAPVFAGGLTAPIEEPVVYVETAVLPAPSADWTGGYAGVQLGYGDVNSDGAGLDGNGAIGGVHAGYLVDFGQFVTGAELSYDAANIDLGAGTDSLDSVARLKLIGGYDLGRTLIYASAGVARASATVGGAGLSDNGYFVGLGADYALTDQWAFGGEVLAHRFNDFAGTGVRLEATTIQAKMAYRF
jgi:opacity protein-like surface antigen